MKSFLRENPTIAFGLGLPLLLVVVFLLISGIPSLLVKSPQYDVLYATQYSSHLKTVQISVVNQKVQVAYHADENDHKQRPRLWRYDAKTGAVREISILFPSTSSRVGRESLGSANATKTVLIDVPDLKALSIDSSSIAPDGYEFSAGRDRYSRNFFGSLFYSSRYSYEVALTKNGRSVRLPSSGGRYYRYDTQFIGWVVSQ
jgi:hypothetical protein